MAEPYGMHVELTALPGRGDELAELLLRAAHGLAADDDCLLYVVSRSPTNPETVWVTEAWTSREAHAASLEEEETRAMIQRALPLLDGRPAGTELRPLGGKGI